MKHVSLTQALAPLVSPITYRRGVYLVLGGVVLAPYVVLALGFWQMYREPTLPVVPVSILAAVTAIIGTVPPFLPALRGIEVAAARSLLGVDLPDPEPDPSWATRSRAAAWFVLHLVSGGFVGVAVLYAVPAAVLSVAAELGASRPVVADLELVPFNAVRGVWVFPVAVGMIVAAVYVVAWMGASMASIAPALLGPSQEERIAALEADARRLAERNRLARELHDSVGHALTVTTLQAAAARRVLDTDPNFARRALHAIEEAGRAAMNDLDHVLGLLRAGTEPQAAGQAAPQRLLADVTQLVDDARAAGVEVTTTIVGDLADVSAAASREAYRIVQEGLTNSLRHAGAVPVQLTVRVDQDGVGIGVTNRLPEATTTAEPAAARAAGRGLQGMRERVRLLGGTMTAGADDTHWRVRVHLPDHHDIEHHHDVHYHEIPPEGR